MVPAIPAVGALLLVLLRHRPRALGPAAVSILVLTLAAALWAAATEPAAAARWSRMIELSVAAEGFGRAMVVLVPLVALPIVAYASVTENDGRARLVTLMLAFVAAMLVLVLAADFLTLLIAWETVGALSWMLIAHGWRDPASARAANRAFLTTRLGDIGLYVAAGVTFAAAGSFAFSAVGSAPPAAQAIIALGVLVAAAAKSAQVPFSPWLFAAMAGPTPVSALLHSATLVAAGAYLLIRLAPDLAAVAWFLPAVAVVGVATAVAGGLVAVVQTNAKRLLAASTSAQYGLMFAAVGAGYPAAAAALLVAHALFKSLLFLGAGVAIHAARTGQLDALRLGRVLPTAAALSAIGALALAAVPPLGAAWAKEEVFAAASTGPLWLLVGVLAAGFLSALYAARYQLLVFGRAVPDARREIRSADARPTRTDRGATLGMAYLAAATVMLGVVWLPGVDRLAEEALGGRLPEGDSWGTVVSIASIGFAFTVVWWLGRRGDLLTMRLPPVMRSATADWAGLPALARVLVERPVAGLSRSLVRIDDRVVDAGVRGAGRIAGFVSGLLSRRTEVAIDGAVRRLGIGTLSTADRSRSMDDRAMDGAVEATGRGVGVAGRHSRRLQGGLSHEYFVIVVVGLAAVAAILVIGR